jgi:hypothetical protein
MILSAGAKGLIICAFCTFLCFLVIQTALGQTWPARVRDGANKDLMVMTLGDVSTPIADGIFDPAKDELRLKEGTILKNYFHDTLGIKYFHAIEQTNPQRSVQSAVCFSSW